MKRKAFLYDNRPMYYCIHCLTGKEDDAAAALRRFFVSNELDDTLVWFPKKVIRLKRRGKVVEKLRPIFPGYIFVLFNYDEKEFLALRLRSASMTIFRALTYGDGTMALRGPDLYVARWIHDHDGRIGVSSARYREGERLAIIDGPMRGMEGLITKVDRHHKKVWLRFSLAGALSRVSFDVDFIESGGGRKAGPAPAT